MGRRLMSRRIKEEAYLELRISKRLKMTSKSSHIRESSNSDLEYLEKFRYLPMQLIYRSTEE